MEPSKFHGGNAISDKYIFSFFLRKVPIVSEHLIVIGSWFQIVGATTEKTLLPIFNLILGTKSCLETDYLRVSLVGNGGRAGYYGLAYVNCHNCSVCLLAPGCQCTPYPWAPVHHCPRVPMHPAPGCQCTPYPWAPVHPCPRVPMHPCPRVPVYALPLIASPRPTPRVAVHPCPWVSVHPCPRVPVHALPLSVSAPLPPGASAPPAPGHYSKWMSPLECWMLNESYWCHPIELFL